MRNEGARQQPRQILVVAPSLPHPTLWGFGVRVYQLIRQLAARHEVSLLAYAEEEDTNRLPSLLPICSEIRTVPRPPWLRHKDRRRQLLSLVRSSSHSIRQYDTPQFRAALQELQQQREFAVIQVESSPLAAFDFSSSSVLLLDEHNLEYELLYRTFQTEHSVPRKLYNGLEYLKLRRGERRLWQRADGCVLTSGREQQVVNQLAPAVATTVVPNGVDIEYFRPPSEPLALRRRNLVYTGLMSYRPNEDAVIYFVRRILPLIVRRHPDVTFTIVGWGPTEAVRQLTGPNVIVTGRVLDTRPHLAGAAVVVVPLRMGGGTRLKVLEGLAMGRPMVSTAIGSEGIAVADGEHLLIRDDPAAFAEAVLEVLVDDSLAARLGRQGRSLVEQQYSWASVADELERFHQERVLAKRRAK